MAKWLLSPLLGYCNFFAYYGPLDLFYDARYSHTEMKNPDFVMLAKSMGVHAIRVQSAEELPEKMKEFLEYDNSKPVLMECVVEKNEHVFPMVVAGKALHEQLLHPTLANASEKASWC